MMAGSEIGAIAAESGALEQLIRLDQLVAVRKSVRKAIPINALISSVIFLVALHYGQASKGAVWFAASCLINLIRFAQCWMPLQVSTNATLTDRRNADLHLHSLSITAAISGLVWAFIPALCAGCTGPQTVFYLTVVCGVTAGAITHGTPYASIPVSFIAPSLISILLCLLYAGGFEYDALATTVFLYTAALIRFAVQAEEGFCEASRLKNQAVRLADSLNEAHSRAVAVAEQLAFRASHDGLSLLLNRAGFMQEVEARLTDETAPFCLMLLDLDGFKSVNDVYGHHAGDRVLVEVARRLSEALDDRFIVSRLGGDEFAIFYDTASVDGIPAELATRLVTSVEVPFVSFDVGRLAACIGVYVGRGRNVTEMLTYADEALYVAKAAGRNRHYIFDETLHERLEMRRDVERDLPRALAEGEVEIWYQPIFQGKTSRPVSLEALLRWRHPRHGFIPPAELIKVAAMAGLAEPLMRHIFEQVCSVIAEIAALGSDPLRVAMNLSPREISRLPIDEIVLAGLQDLGLPAALLEIEITEETALDIRSVQDKLTRLAERGIKITIDDFGVGYSSLATLRQTYISQIKIDHSFVRGVANSKENQILVQTILNLGRSLNVQVVAEGVETEEDLEWLEQTGADLLPGGSLLQGYYLRPPSSRIAVIGWLQQQPAEVKASTSFSVEKEAKRLL